MPGGISEPIGLLAFPTIKGAGYSLFALYLNKCFPDSPKNIVVVGISRMLLGFIFGLLLALVSFPFVFETGLGFLFYFFGLVPIRGLEWWLTIRAFYGARTFQEAKKPVLFGVICSFLLDIPALLGLVFASGFWIC